MRALVPPTATSLVSEEELSTGKMALILLGIGLTGGAVWYFWLRKPAAVSSVPAGASQNPNVTATYVPPTGIPASTVIRPGAPGTFGGPPVPPGVNLTLSPNSNNTALVAAGDYLTLTLPAGATWRGIALGNSANPAVGTSVNLGGDSINPVSIPISAITNIGANAIIAGWTDTSGVSHDSFVSPRLERSPLHL